MKSSSPSESFRITQAVELVSAYVSWNALPASDLPGLIGTVHRTLLSLNTGEAPAPSESAPQPTAAEIKESVRRDGIVSFIDGRSYKTLKRHLTANGLSPAGYRARYGLPADYPMVAPSYSAQRSTIARQTQLGQQGH